MSEAITVVIPPPLAIKLKQISEKQKVEVADLVLRAVIKIIEEEGE